MSRVREKSISFSLADWFRSVGVLVKWRLTMTVVFSSVLAYAIAAGAQTSIMPLLILGLGGFLVAGAANAMNQILERDYDILMERTKNRPVASNTMNVSEAVAIAGMMVLFGVIALALFNPLTAFIGVLSFILYSFIYTPLKRYSTAAVAVGAIPGALPALIGCVAFEGEITWLAIVLFAIQFIWQFPHFWAIGWLAFEQYRDAGFKLLPEEQGKVHPSLGFHSLVYSLMLVPICLLSFVFGVTGIVTTTLIAVISLWYIYKSYVFYRSFDRPSARKLMFASFAYIPLVFTLILIGSLM